jgi:hypothetical protein
MVEAEVSLVKEPVQVNAFELLKAPARDTHLITSLSGYGIQSLISEWYDKQMSDNSTWDCSKPRDKRRVIAVMK